MANQYKNALELDPIVKTVTSSTDTKATPIVAPEYTKLTYTIQVSNVSGTNPTLEVKLLGKNPSGAWSFIESMTGGTVSASYSYSTTINANFVQYAIEYVVGGTSPSFDVTIDLIFKAQ